MGLESARPLGYHDNTPRDIMEKARLWSELIHGCVSLPREKQNEIVDKISEVAAQRDQLTYDFGRKVVNILIDELKPDYPQIFLKSAEMSEQASYGTISRTELNPEEEEILNLFREIRFDASRIPPKYT